MVVDPKEEVVEAQEELEEEEEEEQVEGERPRRRAGRKTVRVRRGEVWVLNVQTGEARKASSETVEYDPATHLIFIAYIGKRSLRIKLIRVPRELDKMEAFRKALRAIQLV